MIVKLIDKLWEETKTAPALLFTVLCLVGVSTWGWNNYARASDLHTYVTSTEFIAVKEELTSEISTMSTQVQTNSTIITEIYSISLSSEIRDLHTEYCRMNPGIAKSALINSINRLQNKHVSLMGERYPVEACE